MSLKHAIIALLDLEEGTGYDLVKRFNSSVGHFWSSTHQQVYQELGRLADQGWVAFTQVEQVGKPDKKIYRVTPLGMAELRDWLLKPTKSLKAKDPLLVKIFAGRHTSREALLEELARHEREHLDTLKGYERIENGLKRSGAIKEKRYLLPYMTMRLGIRIEKAYLDWVDEVREALRSHE